LQLEAGALEPVIKKRPDAELHVIGMGAKHLPLIEPRSRVVVAGLAGALAPDLGVGDLVVDAPPGVPLSHSWRAGKIHTAGHLVATPAEKVVVFRDTGALAVDMEQAVVRRALAQDTMVIGLRAISDTADLAVDPAVVRMVDSTGRPRPLAIAGALLRHPTLMGHLRQLQANSRLALSRLTPALDLLLDHLESIV
jgi:hypothetical protein